MTSNELNEVAKYAELRNKTRSEYARDLILRGMESDRIWFAE
jgi:hypothetical protein